MKMYYLIVKMIDIISKLSIFFQMVDNPWNVDSIWAFTFLKCPECIFDTQEESIFRDHAAKNHPLSFVFFGWNDVVKKEDEADNDSLSGWNSF